MMGLAASKRFGWRLVSRPDDELIAAALNGQGAAFAELATRYRAQVERLCWRFFNDQEIARDIAQETFLRAYASLSRYRKEMPFAGWLRAIVTNLCYDELRRRRRRPEELIADFAAPEVQWMRLVTEASPEQIVSEAQERHEAYEFAHRLLDTLKPEDRTVLIMKDSEQMKIGDIAEAMGWSVAKVKIRAFRARQALRRQAQRLRVIARRGS
jgi:RNA polymerase sigma-70 factor (ECF subfamily)